MPRTPTTRGRAIKKRTASALRPLVLAKDGPELLTIFAFADCHAQDPRVILHWLRASSAKPDIVLYSGDGLERFCPRGEANYLAEIAAETRFGLGAVLGNRDSGRERPSMLPKPDAKRLEELSGHGVFNLHTTPLLIGRFLLLGLEGRPVRCDPGSSHPNHIVRKVHLWDVSTDLHSREDRARTHLERCLPHQQSIENGPVVILCSHAPPWGLADTGASGDHFGWTTLTKTILGPTSDYPISLVVCGHVHACGGRREKYDLTTVVNVASHDDPGEPLNAAVISMTVPERQMTSLAAEPEVSWVQLAPEWPQEAGSNPTQAMLETGNLTAVPGLGGRRAEVLESSGIDSIRKLALASWEELKALRGSLSIGEKELRLLQKRAAAAVSGTYTSLQPLTIPKGRRVYLDLETSFRQTEYIFIIACLDDDTNEEFLFATERGTTPEQRELNMLKDFIRFVKKRKAASWLSYSGTDLEMRCLSARFAAHGLPGADTLVHLDLYKSIHESTAFPTSDLRLKTIAASLGYVFKSQGMDGWAAGMVGGALSKGTGAIPEGLTEYALDDVRALRHIIEEIEGR